MYYTEIERKHTRNGYFILYYKHFDSVWRYKLKYVERGNERTIDSFETKFFAMLKMNRMVKRFGGEIKK